MSEESQDMFLDAQLKVDLISVEGLNREDLFTLILNNLMMASNDVFYIQHMDRFEVGSKDYKKASTFDTIKEDLKDVIMYTFCLLNKLHIDTPSYQDMVEFKSSIPMLIRTDKTLACSSMIRAISELMETVWIKLDEGVSTIGQADLRDGVTEEKNGVAEEVLDFVIHILAMVDTLCQHYGKSIKDVL